MKSIQLMLLGLLCLVFLGSLSSFSSESASKKQVLRHVVSFQFKEDISKERQAQAIKDFLDLKNQIPEIKKFEGGEDVSVEGLNKGFTHCFVMTFESKEARDIYIPHPAHIKLAEKNKPLMRDLLVVDYWGEE